MGLDGDWHFLTCSYYRRRKFFGSVNRRDLFLEIPEQVRAKYDFVVAGYSADQRASGEETLAGDAGVEAACLSAASRQKRKNANQMRAQHPPRRHRDTEKGKNLSPQICADGRRCCVLHLDSLAIFGIPGNLF